MQKNILVLGAGKSSAVLIRTLIRESENKPIKIIVADSSFKAAESKTNRHPNTAALELDIHNSIHRAELIGNSDVIISLLPPDMHILAAADAVHFGRHFINASYLSDDIKALDYEARQNGSFVLCEMGLDPGIDHLINKKMIDDIHREGGKINSLRSYCGGLIAPDNARDNPWQYKFTWNPRNVVLAGQSAARLLRNGEVKYIPASRIFSTLERIDLEGEGTFEAYPNRDSLKYIKPYQIEGAKTVIRGTLRYEGFCKKWDILREIGLTDNTLEIGNEGIALAGLVESYLPTGTDLHSFLEKHGVKKADEVFEALRWLGIFDALPLKPKRGTAADYLLSVLEEKWKLLEGDLDYVIQYNEVGYEKEGRHYARSNYFGINGADETHTAMAMTVGLPLAHAALLLVEGKLNVTGVHLPLLPELYHPVLGALQKEGVRFTESEREILV